MVIIVFSSSIMDFDIDPSDITVLNSYIDIVNGNKLKYLIYEMKVKDTTGEYIKIFKAIKLLRIKRLPKIAKQETKFMDIHSELLSGMWERQVDLITIIANIIHPVSLGLLFCYGVQGVAYDVDEAKRLADNDYAAIMAAIQGAYRTMEFDDLTYDEIDWLRDKISNMKNLSMVRGLPYPRKAAADSETTSIGGKDLSPDSQETTEEVVAGLSDKEYVLMMISTPVDPDTLTDWLTVCSKNNTKWQSQMQGSSGMSAGISLPMMFMGNIGASQGWNHGYSDATNIGASHNIAHGTTLGESFGQTSTISHGTNHNIGTGQNENLSHGVSSNTSTSNGQSFGENQSYSHNQSVGHSHTDGTSMNVTDSSSVSQNHSTGVNESFSSSQSHSSGTSATNTHSEGGTHNVGTSENTSISQNQSYGHTDSTSHSTSNTVGVNASYSEGVSAGVPGVASANASMSVGVSASHGTSNGQSASDSSTTGYGTSQGNGVNESYGSNISNGQSFGHTSSDSVSSGHSAGTNESWGNSVSQSHGVSQGVTSSDGSTVTNAQGFSQGTSQTASLTNSAGNGTSDSISKGVNVSDSNGTSDSLSNGTTHTQSASSSLTNSDGTSWGQSQGTNGGISGAINTGMSSSVGIGFSASINKTYQFVDVEVRNLVQMYEFQNERLMKALNGQGAFFVDMYMATPNDETKSAATTLAKSAWGNNQAFICPLQIIDLEGDEKDHLFYHLASFSACHAKESKGNINGYRYSTILLSDELTAYTHPVRMSEGGQFADIENIPTFAIPSMMKGEIYLGKIISGERWNKTYGYKTVFDYRLDGTAMLHHIWIQGASRSGKTVLAMRLVTEIAIKTRRQDKRMRIIVLDPKQDWRTLGLFIESDRFKFYSLGDPDYLPIKFNLLKIPKGVRPQVYADGVIEGYCRAYQLGEKVKPILRDAIYSAYKDAEVFEVDENWRDNVSEKSKDVTFPLIYQRIKAKLEMMKAQRGTANMIEAYERLLDRLDMFSKPYTTEYRLFGQGGDIGISIDEILGDDDVTILESFGLDPIFKSFVFGLITTAIYQYAYAHPGGFKAPDQYSTMLVIEEANEVLIGQGGDGQQSTVQGTSMFEKIVDQAAGLELFICAITQKLADMPQSIIANAGLNFALRSVREVDKDVIMNSFGKDPKIEDKAVLKFLPLMPIGYCICKASRGFEYKEQAPVLIAADRLDVDPPTDSELKAIVQLAEIKKSMNKKNE